MEQPFERGITCSVGSIDHEATTSISGVVQVPIMFFITFRTYPSANILTVGTTGLAFGKTNNKLVD